MKFRNLFYDSAINLKSISIGRLIIAILLGIASALTIYSFFFILVETFRYINILTDEGPRVLSEESRKYYSLFFSALSVVLGNSIAFNFIFSKPQKIMHRYNSKRKRLLNDNIFLSFNFSYWFSKVGLSFGIFAMCCMEFEFLPYFKELSFLLIAVLYLESIKSFSFFLKNSQRLRFVIVHVICLSIISFAISNINVVDYKGLDKAMLKNNPIMDLPHSTFYNDIDYRRYYSIQIKMKEDSLGNLNIYSNNKKYAFDEIRSVINQERSYMREEMMPYVRLELEANKECNIYHIKRLEQIFITMSIYRVTYIVKTDEAIFARFVNRGISKRLDSKLLKIEDTLSTPMPPFPMPPPKYSGMSFKDSIYVSVGRNIKINDDIVARENLVQKFVELYSKETLFIYKHNKETKYQEFIDVFSNHYQAVDNLRKTKQTIFKDLQFINYTDYREEQRKLREEFPLIFKEEFN